MGNWKLEAFRVAIYMSFPVGTFYWFNQPENFEKWIIEQRKHFYQENENARKEVMKTRAIIEQRRLVKLEKDLKKLEDAI